MTDPLPKPEPDDDDDDDLPIVVKEPGDVRKLRFSDARINAAVSEQLAGVPATARGALVATAFKEGGQIKNKLALYVNRSFRKFDASFGGFIEGDVKRPLEKVGAELRFVW